MATPTGRATSHDEREMICRRLFDCWDAHPQLRLGQLVVNLAGTRDLFCIEDADFLGAALTYGAPGLTEEELAYGRALAQRIK